MRLKLKGEQAVIDSLQEVNDTLSKSGGFLKDIDTKSRALDNMTKRLQTMAKELESVNRRLDAARNGTGSGNANTLEAQQKKLTTEIKNTTTAATNLRKELAGVDQGSQAYSDLVRKIAQTKVEQKLLNDQIREQQRQFEQTKVAAGSYRDLDLKLQGLRAQYKLLGDAQREGTQGKELLNQITQLDLKLKEIDKGMGVYTRNVGNYASAFDGFVGIATRLGSVLGVTLGASTFIQANEKVSDSVADVAKTANISIDAVRKFQEELKKRDTRTNLADQLGIAEIGGQLGVVEDQLLNFTKATDVVTVALKDEFGGSVQEVTKQVATLRNVLPGLKTDDIGTDILNIGNALNFLSASGNATAPVIADFANRLSGVAGPLNISAASVFGLSATLDELGVSAERGATSVQKVLVKIASEPGKFAKIAGKDLKEFTQIINTDIVQALGLVAQGAQQSTEKNTEFVKILADLGIKGSREVEVFGKLGTAYDRLNEQIAEAGKALKDTGSVMQEFDKKNNTLAANVDKLKNSIINLSVNTDFQDFLSGAIQGLVSFINALATLPKLISENKTELAALTLAILAFNREQVIATIATIKQSSAYLLLTDATRRQAIAQGIMNSVMKALPLLAIIGLVYGAVKAYQALTASTDAAANAAKRVRDAQKEISDETAKEASVLARSIEILKSAASSTQDRAKAIKDLQEAYPEYLQGLDLEKLSVSQLTDLQNKLTAEIIRSVAERKKAIAQDEVASKIIEKQLRISAIQRGGQGEVSFAEQLRLGKGGTDIKGNVSAVITGLQGELQDLQKEFQETGRQFDEAFGLRNTGTEQRAASAGEDLINEKKVLNKKLGDLDDERTKEEQRRIDEAAKKRLEDERRAAENIFKLQQDLIAKTFEGRKQLARNETTNAISALVGTPQQIETQKTLLKQKLKETIDDIEKERQAAQGRALDEIERFKLEASQRAAQSALGSVGNQLQAGKNVAAIDEFKAQADNTGRKAQLDKEFADGLISQQDYNEKSKQLELDLQRQVLEIKNQAFINEKQLLFSQQSSKLATLASGYKLELEQLAEAEKARAAELKSQAETGAIDDGTLQQALIDNEAAFRQQRLDAERAFREEQSQIIQEAALGIIQTETQLAEQQRAIQAETDAQKLESARRTKEFAINLQNAQLDAVGEYVSGVSRLLAADQENRKKYGGVLKVLALAEIAINLRRELSAISLAAINAGVATGPFGFLTAGGIYAAQSAAAIIKATFNAAGVLATKFKYGGTIPTDESTARVEGGSIPSASGEIKGRSHSAGGVKAIYNNRLVEFEGGEYHLRNGAETYIINKRSTAKYRDALLRMSDRPNTFSRARKEIASKINSHRGWGKPLKYADGGVLNVNPLAAPQVQPSGGAFVVNAASRDDLAAVLQLASGAIAMAEAANNRIDNIQVINNPLETLDAGSAAAEVRSVRNL